METPEGAILNIAVAGPVPRGLAWLVDGCIRFLVLFVIYILFPLAGISDYESGGVLAAIGIVMILQFLLTWFYTTAFEAITGTTPGKHLFNLRVVHDNATPITWSGSLIRNFLRVVDFLPFFYLVGFTSMLIDGRFRRLGDLAAGTLVVYKNDKPHSRTFSHTVGSPPPDWLSREERSAVVDFAERSSALSPDRQKELAEILDPITGGVDDKVGTLKSWAHWIIHGQDDAESKGV